MTADIKLKPCPLCGREVSGHVCGGVAAFGCGEWEYEIECSCGLLYNNGPWDTQDAAVRGGIMGWNRRWQRPYPNQLRAVLD